MSLRITLNNVEYHKRKCQTFKRYTLYFFYRDYLCGWKKWSGKSSLLKLIATAMYPDKGEILYTKLMNTETEGKYRKKFSIEEVRRIIGFMPQHYTGHPDMTIERYLKYIALHKGIPHSLVKSTIEKWLKETNLSSLKRRKLRTLSGGQLQKVGLIQALINQPRICILDEPFEGLDIAERLYFQRVIQRLSFHSIVVISTHLIEEII